MEDEQVAKALRALRRVADLAQTTGLQDRHTAGAALLQEIAGLGTTQVVNQAKIASWTQWCKDALDTAGAGKAHRWAKQPTRWQPATTTTSKGLVTSAPQAVADAQQKHFRKLWGAYERSLVKQPLFRQPNEHP